MTRLVCLCLLSNFLGLLIPSYFLNCFLHDYHYLLFNCYATYLIADNNNHSSSHLTQQVSYEIIDLERIVLLDMHSDNSVKAVCA